MATMNPFDLLGDDDAEDPSQLLAAQKVAPPKKSTAPASVAPPANKQPAPARLPSKPLPPAQAVREARREGGRGGGRGGGGRGYGRGRRGYGWDSARDENSRSPTGGQGSHEDGDAKRQAERHGYGGPQGGYRGGRHGGFTNGEVGDEERPHRSFDQHSGIGRGNEIKREGAGHINWGTRNDEFAQVNKEVVVEGEKNLGGKVVEEETAADGSKDTTATESEEKEPEDKEMTLEEYEKVLEEKRKALQALKTEERKVDAKVFESMQQLSSKKDNDDVFIKLGSEKDKRKETLEKDEKAKKSVSINEFLKPAEGEKYYSPGGGRGRGRGRGRGAWGLGGRDAMSIMMAPAIEDPGQFPTLGGK